MYHIPEPFCYIYTIIYNNKTAVKLEYGRQIPGSMFSCPGGHEVSIVRKFIFRIVQWIEWNIESTHALLNNQPSTLIKTFPLIQFIE